MERRGPDRSVTRPGCSGNVIVPLRAWPSVASDTRVDLDAVTVDASCEVCNAGEPRREKTARAIEAAHSAMAVDDCFACSIERVHLRLELGEWNQQGTRQAADLPLPWLAHIDDLHTAREQVLQVRGRERVDFIRGA